MNASGRWRWSAGRITDFANRLHPARRQHQREMPNGTDRGRHCIAAAHNLGVGARAMEMAASPGPFAGRCRIIGMDDWEGDFLPLVEVAHLTFDDKSGGQIGFVASKDFLDVRYHAISKGDASERVASQWT